MRLYTRINVFRRETVERRYECPRCKTTGVATMRARGQSGWQRKRLFDDAQVDIARESAQIAMQLDADRIMSLMHCPGCGQRAPRAGMWSAIRVAWSGAVVLVVGTALLWAHGVFSTPGWLAPAFLGVGLVLAAVTEIRRWTEADRGERSIAQVKPGPPEAGLPRAVARTTPPRPSAPLEPLRSSEPDRGDGAAPTEGPRVLR